MAIEPISSSTTARHGQGHGQRPRKGSDGAGAFGDPSRDPNGDAAEAEAAGEDYGERLGRLLQRAREQRSLGLGDVAAATKIPRSTLETLERGALASLPAEVFVRGFIRSYAKVVALAESEPLALYDRALKARNEATRVEAAKPVPLIDPAVAGLAADDDRDGMAPRRGLGLAVFVIILLLIATITLSLLLRRPPQSGEGLSQLPAPSATPARTAPV